MPPTISAPHLFYNPSPGHEKWLCKSLWENPHFFFHYIPQLIYAETGQATEQRRPSGPDSETQSPVRVSSRTIQASLEGKQPAGRKITLQGVARHPWWTVVGIVSLDTPPLLSNLLL